ncbi:MAG: LLM class flavin-dependent oxidoreductase [Pseudomonadota bacterium]
MLKIGIATPPNLWRQSIDERRATVHAVAEHGIDHIFMADHVSFHDGSGTDGFIEVAALSQLHPNLEVMISIYLLPLRHPLPVARQLATMQRIAGNRMIFGVGIGGEDRHEIEVCGVDPSTRGRRMNESLEIVRALMRGDKVSLDGEFFQIENAVIKPAIDPPIPIIVGGRSNAALRRTGRYGDGWVGTWCSVRRFKEALELVDASAREANRGVVDWLHGYQPWVGVGDTRDAARKLVADAMESFYKVPFEQFERYTPYGTPDDVAEALGPYVDAGCKLMNLKVVAGDEEATMAAAGEIATALRKRAEGIYDSGTDEATSVELGP